MEIEKIIKNLKSERKVFFSESDFQFALAWEIQKFYDKAKIRLEYPFQYEEDGKNRYIDIIVTLEDKKYPIELKYKTLSLEVEDNGEEYKLKNQGAQDHGRYDYLKDIQRIEKFSESKKYKEKFECGYAILLTNDESYWNNDKAGCVDEQFSLKPLKDNTPIPKKMSWRENPKPSKGTISGREASIELTGEYTINWKDYHNFGDKNGEFKYCLIEIKKGI